MRDIIEMAREAGGRAQQNKNCDVEYLMSDDAIKVFAQLVRADERNALTKERDKLRNRIAYLLQPPIVVAVGCFLFAYIVGFK